MTRQPRLNRRNPVAKSPIMRKGGAHQKSRSGERQKEKNQLKKLVSQQRAGDSGSQFFHYVTCLYNPSKTQTA